MVTLHQLIGETLRLSSALADADIHSAVLLSALCAAGGEQTSSSSL